MEYNYGKTHDVGKEGGKQAEKPTLEANRHESEGKVGVGARWWAGKPTIWAWSTEIKQKNPLRVFFEKKASKKTQTGN